jgi:hypothetical protein
MPFSPEIERDLIESIDFATHCTLAVPRTALVRTLDAVRTTVLNWSLKLEEDGICGEGLAFTPQERAAAETTSYNINNFFGPVQNSQIQQQTRESSQILSIGQVDLDSLGRFLAALQKEIMALAIPPEAQQELEAEISTAQAQLKSPKPKHLIVRESLATIRRILEGAGGGVAAKLLMQMAGLTV